MDTTFPPHEPGRHGWAELLGLVGVLRRLAFAQNLPPAEALGRIRDLFAGYDDHEGHIRSVCLTWRLAVCEHSTARANQGEITPMTSRAIAAVITALTLAACVGGGEGTETTTTAPAVETSAPTQAQETASAGAEEVDVFALEVGDCLTDYRATEGVVSVPTVPCSEPHSGEIYAVVPLPEGDGNYPGVEAISAQAEELCIAEFEGFVGLSYEESVLEFSYLAPEETEWDAGDREVLCMVHDPAGVTTGTLADANR